MKRKLVVLSILLFCFALKAESQIEINKYKYVIVPLQYDFLKGQDVYRLNTLTKFLFNESEFSVYFEKQELPEELFKDRCMALYADVKNVNGGFRKTGLEITLRDCKGELIFKSDVGKSGENNHEKRHQNALRAAFKSIEKLGYKYVSKQTNPVEDEVDIPEAKDTEEIKSDEAVDKNSGLKIIKANETSLIEDKIEVNEDSTDLIKEKKESKSKTQNGLHQERYPDKTIIQSNIPKAYNAKKIDIGYEIYSSSLNEYLFTMYPTILNEVYIFQDEGVSGNIIKRENGNWIKVAIKEGEYSVEKIKLTF